MYNINSKQIENREFFGVSDEYPETVKLNVIKRNVTNVNLKKLQNRNELEVKNLIIKNKKLLAIVAHEIRTPMSLMINYLRLAKESIDNIDKQQIETKIESALLSAEKSITILDRLLKWALKENAVKSFNQKGINISSLIQEEIDEMESLAPLK